MFQISSFEFRIPGFSFWIWGFEIRVSSFPFWILGFGIRVSSFVEASPQDYQAASRPDNAMIPTSKIRFRVSGSRFRISGFGFRISDYGFRLRVSGTAASSSCFSIVRIMTFSGSTPSFRPTTLCPALDDIGRPSGVDTAGPFAGLERKLKRSQNVEPFFSLDGRWPMAITVW